MRKITPNTLRRYRDHLINEEKAELTVEKYMRDVEAFAEWLGERETDKQAVIAYKEEIIKKFAPRSVNSILSSLNSLFDYLIWHDCKVKMLKIQKQIFADRSKELTRGEYERLLSAAKKAKNERLYLLMQTICSTGIRVSELRYITAEAVNARRAVIRCKGKLRMVFLPHDLCKMLRNYTKSRGIKSGPVFVTRSGRPLDRSNIWSEMKRLCQAARVLPGKVFPHNFRHLFARTFYKAKKDIVRLADVLGHSSINTTRIYTMESGEAHRRCIEQLHLLRC